MRDALATNAFNQGVTKRGTRGLPGGINPRGITPFTGGTVSVGDPTDFTALAANAIPFNIQNPRIEQFNVTFEREVGWNTGVRISYVGTRQHGLIAGRDLNEIPPSDIPFGVHNEDGNFCDPFGEGDCIISPEDAARLPFPRLGTFLATYGNTGKGRSHALQIEVNRRFARGLTFNASYTLLDQKSNGIDTGNSTLGGTLYDQFTPQTDFSTDSFVSRHRFVTYGAFELPFGRDRKFGKSASGVVDAVAGGWDITWQGFAKSGTGFTPFWQCDDCGNIGPGNVGSDFIDAIGDFNQSLTYRPLVIGDPYANLSGDQFFNPDAFALPPLGSDLFSNPLVAKRNSLTGPGTWGLNLGIHKYFKFSETTRLEVGADFNNVFNHPLFSPLDTGFALLGNFSIGVDPATGNLFFADVTPNPDFGRNNISYSQEGIDNRRSVRLRFRLTF